MPGTDLTNISLYRYASLARYLTGNRGSELAGKLDHSGFACFVAHDDIEPSRAWQQTIETALDTCDVLVAYVTQDFSTSNWTDQEVGWALGRGRLIVPIRAGSLPYGFFGSYQAVPLSGSTFELAAAITRAICDATYTGQRPHAAVVTSRLARTLVEGFARSGSKNAPWRQATNATARALYDKVAERTGFIQYKKTF